MLVAAQGGVLLGVSTAIKNTSTSTGVRSGTLAIVNDGTYTATGATSLNWFTPTTAGVGSQWSVKLTITSQSNTTPSGTFGSFVSLAASPTWGFANSSISVEGTGTFTLAFSPDGGTTTALTTTSTWDVGFAP